MKILVILQNKSGQKIVLLFLTQCKVISLLFLSISIIPSCFAVIAQFSFCYSREFYLRTKCELPWSKTDGYRRRVLFTHILNYCLGTQSKNMLGDENITYCVFILFKKNLNSEAVARSLKTTSPLSRHSELFNNNSDTVLETQFSTP